MSVTEADEQAAIDHAELRERQVGTAFRLLRLRNQDKAASLLLQADEVKWDWSHDNWGTEYTNVLLLLRHDLFDSFVLFDPDDKEAPPAQIRDALNHVLMGQDECVSVVRAIPTLVDRDWREKALTDGLTHPTNQAAIAPLPPNHPKQDGFKFRDDAEKRLYLALKWKQEQLPRRNTMTLAVNPMIRIPGHTWEPDFLVTYRGRTGVIEVDGGTHRKKWADDKSRDGLLRDAGISFVERLPIESTVDEPELMLFVETFLDRLMR